MISDVIRSHLPRTKATPSGWQSMNCPACVHHGHRPDTRSRGGIIFTGEGFSYHCFNCNFKTKWEPGSYLSKKSSDFMGYLGVDKSVITKCKLYAMNSDDEEVEKISVEQRIYNLPKDARTFNELISENFSDRNFMKCLEYLANRNVNLLDWYTFYWQPEHKNGIIIPVYMSEKIVGFNVRYVTGKIKYFAQVHKSVVFNSDVLYNDRKYCIITEGPFDAISLNATATMSNEITDGQLNQYKSSNQIKIVVPDKDNAGRNFIDVAMDQNWLVSFPEWPEKDVADAVAKYGRIPVMAHIMDSVEKSPLKINMKTKKYVGATIA